MDKLNYIVTSASSTFQGGNVNDTDMFFPFAGDKQQGITIISPSKGSVTQKGREGRTTIIDLNMDDTWGYITEEEFVELDNIEYLGFNGKYHVYQDADDFSYADDAKDEKTREEKREERKANRQQRRATRREGRMVVGDDGKLRKKYFSETAFGKFVKSIPNWFKNLKTKFGEAIKKRRENRLNRKSQREELAHKRALEIANAKGLSQEEALKVASEAAMKVKAEQEKAIQDVEKQTLETELKNGKTQEQAEQKANEAGQKTENEVFGGYIADDGKKGFWESMGTGGKIAIIGGGALFVGLVLYLILKKNKQVSPTPNVQ